MQSAHILICAEWEVLKPKLLYKIFPNVRISVLLYINLIKHYLQWMQL